MFKVLIAGGREFNDYDLLKKQCDLILKDVARRDTIVVVSGGARGADKLGEKYANEKGYTIEQYIPDWNGPLGKGAGFARNKQMVDVANGVIVFWDQASKGTGHTVELAKAKNIPLRIVKY